MTTPDPVEAHEWTPWGLRVSIHGYLTDGRRLSVTLPYYAEELRGEAATMARRELEERRGRIVEDEERTGRYSCCQGVIPAHDVECPAVPPDVDAAEQRERSEPT